MHLSPAGNKPSKDLSVACMHMSSSSPVGHALAGSVYKGCKAGHLRMARAIRKEDGSGWLVVDIYMIPGTLLLPGSAQPWHTCFISARPTPASLTSPLSNCCLLVTWVGHVYTASRYLLEKVA